MLISKLNIILCVRLSGFRQKLAGATEKVILPFIEPSAASRSKFPTLQIVPITVSATYRFFRFKESLYPDSWYIDKLPQDAL